ncbi:DnaJ-domain-containing protein [Vararia minispora EC-137]|uniref:DnaJ-domain-containing protein n=1 Tax=Vararia minispora EC-137 TaxID=1314806 RepID=A0ACB8QB38_9AGAM|nr:DnaJ-domain-containing protein [Vararia minispora EC-137]
MLGYVISSATQYFYLPIDEEPNHDEHGIPAHSKLISWGDIVDDDAPGYPEEKGRHEPPSPAIEEILAVDNLYEILGVPQHRQLDENSLRRAYLARTRACHPDKFFGDPKATLAFQKVAVAYNILSNPTHKKQYDQNPAMSTDFASTMNMRAEDTLQGAVLGMFNDFLDGDMEVVQTLLRAMANLNPSLSLNDEGIDSILLTLRVIRERLLTCRALSHAVVATISHLAETQHSLAQLPLFSIRPRARLSIRLARITLALPLALEDVLWTEKRARARSRTRRRWDRDLDWGDPVLSDSDGTCSRAERAVALPRRILFLIEGVVYGLEKIESMI